MPKYLVKASRKQAACLVGMMNIRVLRRTLKSSWNPWRTEILEHQGEEIAMLSPPGAQDRALIFFFLWFMSFVSYHKNLSQAHKIFSHVFF